MNSWEKNSISPEFHPATKPLTVEPVDSGNEIGRRVKLWGNGIIRINSNFFDWLFQYNSLRTQTYFRKLLMKLLAAILPRFLEFVRLCFAVSWP